MLFIIVCQFSRILISYPNVIERNRGYPLNFVNYIKRQATNEFKQKKNRNLIQWRPTVSLKTWTTFCVHFHLPLFKYIIGIQLKLFNWILKIYFFYYFIRHYQTLSVFSFAPPTHNFYRVLILTKQHKTIFSNKFNDTIRKS